MAESGGHWATLAEAQKLTQSTKVPGVIEQDIKRNNPLDRLPVAQAAGTGLKIEWLRESTTTEDAVGEANVGQQLTWGEDMTYTEVESTLRYMYIQRKLDRYVQGIYGTYNDYKAQVLLEMEKGLKRKIGDRLLYADTTYGGAPTQFDGLHALAAEFSTSPGTGVNVNHNIDQNGALSLANLRLAIDAMKYGCDEIWMPPCLSVQLNAAYEEKGFAGLATASAGSLGLITRGINEIGTPILYFAGIPIVVTDYLVAEQDGTGTGATSNARAKYSSGTKTYSVFLVKKGNVMARDPGICFAYGGTEGAGDLYSLYLWDRLEDYNAGGMRMDSYGTVLLGASLGLGRIFDITDAAIVV